MQPRELKDLAWKPGSTWTDGDACAVPWMHSVWAAQFLFSSFSGASWTHFHEAVQCLHLSFSSSIIWSLHSPVFGYTDCYCFCFFFSCEHVVVVFSLFDRYIAAGAGLPLHPQHNAVTSNSTERAQSSRGWERLGAWALGGRHTLQHVLVKDVSWAATCKGGSRRGQPK